MTTVTPPAAAPESITVAAPPLEAGCLRWSWRLVRRGALLMWLTVAAYMTVEVISFRSAYPDAESRQKLLDLSSSTAVRMLQGTPGAIDTAGGFSVWDSGWMITLIVSCWAILTVTRLTRGEEDSGRIELLLSRPVDARRVLAANFAGMGVALAGIAISAAAPLVVFGQPGAGALLWGVGLALFGTVMAALAALCAQLTQPRRRVASVALGLAAIAFLARIVANSADNRAWALVLTPFGWLDRLHVFAGDRWLWLAAPLSTALLLGAAALALCVRRDTGAALLRSHESRRSHFYLLGNGSRFLWRLTSPALVGWTLAVSITCLVFGLMIGAVVDFIAQDETYRRLLHSMGMDMSAPVIGFLSYIAQFMALPLACFLGWRLGAVRQEEADGRLDNLLVRGMIRWRWLAIITAQAFAAAALLAAASGVSLWAGGQLVDSGVTAAQVAEPMAATLPLLALSTGIATLSFGLVPRLTIALPVTITVLSYLLETFGTMLGWPSSAVGISPFHHLARLPSTPMTTTSILVLTSTGLATAAIGITAFAHRDQHGA
jgi:ABC-2 type transport system permease protein